MKQHQRTDIDVFLAYAPQLRLRSEWESAQSELPVILGAYVLAVAF